MFCVNLCVKKQEIPQKMSCANQKNYIGVSFLLSSVNLSKKECFEKKMNRMLYILFVF